VHLFFANALCPDDHVALECSTTVTTKKAEVSVLTDASGMYMLEQSINENLLTQKTETLQMMQSCLSA